MGLERVISGGQTGSDLAGWRAAKRCGIPTGGWLPSGFLTEDGPRPEFADLYGAREMATTDYPTRTKANVRDSDATLWFGDHETPGARATFRATIELECPCLVTSGSTPASVAGWITSHNVRVLNISGNRASSNPGIGERTEAYLLEVFALLGFHPIEGHGP